MSAVFQRILLFLGVCLPVPLLAATGLSIPLPATVERLAAGLVPFAEAATLEADDSAGAKRGVIVRTPTQKTVEARRPTPAAGRVALTRPARAAVPRKMAKPKPKPGQPKSSPATAGPKSPGIPGGGSGGTPQPGTEP